MSGRHTSAARARQRGGYRRRGTNGKGVGAVRLLLPIVAIVMMSCYLAGASGEVAVGQMMQPALPREFMQRVFAAGRPKVTGSPARPTPAAAAAPARETPETPPT